MRFSNIYSLFRAQTESCKDRSIFYTRNGETWDAQTWGEFADKVHDFACALLAKGLTKGASVAILAGNVPEWTICDIGTIAAGGVGVGIYPTSSTEQCEYIVNHSDAQFLFVDSYEQYEKVTNSSSPFPNLKEIIIAGKIDETSAKLVDRSGWISYDVKYIPVTNFDDFLRFGNQNRHDFLRKVETVGTSSDPDETAIMVYTSGTTGQPKGAMLSHRYILNSVESLRRSVPIFESDVALSYLPGCHVAERISGIYNRLYNGTAAYFIEDLTRLYEYMLDVKPTVFASLPRFFEKIHAKVVAEFGTDDVPSQKLKDAFGGQIRLLTSGGAPLPLEIADFFARRGLPILQAYGLTENICVAFNTVSEFKFGTVGKPMPMCKVKIAADGEILVKSPMMFSGYYKQPDETAAMFDANGWLKTGDLGAVDDDGFLKITGRKKEIIVLSSGKNVAPSLIENFVKESHLISHCLLYGEGRSYCVAIITLNELETASFARTNAIRFDNFAEMTRDERIINVIKEIVARANARVSRTEQIKKFAILECDFSAERSEITPTMKAKRDIVASNYKDILEKLYERSS